MRTLELEARLDHLVRRRLRIIRRDAQHWLRSAVLLALIAAAARGLVYVLSTLH